MRYVWSDAGSPEVLIVDATPAFRAGSIALARKSAGTDGGRLKRALFAFSSILITLALVVSIGSGDLCNQSACRWKKSLPISGREICFFGRFVTYGGGEGDRGCIVARSSADALLRRAGTGGSSSSLITGGAKAKREDLRTNIGLAGEGSRDGTRDEGARTKSAISILLNTRRRGGRVAGLGLTGDESASIGIWSSENSVVGGLATIVLGSTVHNMTVLSCPVETKRLLGSVVSASAFGRSARSVTPSVCADSRASKICLSRS